LYVSLCIIDITLSPCLLCILCPSPLSGQYRSFWQIAWAWVGFFLTHFFQDRQRLLTNIQNMKSSRSEALEPVLNWASYTGLEMPIVYTPPQLHTQQHQSIGVYLWHMGAQWSPISTVSVPCIQPWLKIWNGKFNYEQFISFKSSAFLSSVMKSRRWILPLFSVSTLYMLPTH
jgi:hypothetical protein